MEEVGPAHRTLDTDVRQRIKRTKRPLRIDPSSKHDNRVKSLSRPKIERRIRFFQGGSQQAGYYGTAEGIHDQQREKNEHTDTEKAPRRDSPKSEDGQPSQQQN